MVGPVLGRGGGGEVAMVDWFFWARLGASVSSWGAGVSGGTDGRMNSYWILVSWMIVGGAR